MTLESSIERTAVRKAEAAGWIVRKVSWLNRRGACDRVFLGHGRCVWIEFKRPGEYVDHYTQQGREFLRMKEAYPEVYEANTVEKALAILGVAV